MDFDKAYKTLNKAQKQAVDTIDGPVLVVAGPGTGKTHLLATRAANILNKTDAAGQNILCLTYTEAATRNMRERLSQLIGKSAYDIRISTYHGFGSEIIRQYREYFADFNGDQAVDEIGQNQIMHEIYESLPANNMLWRKDVYLKDVLNFISEAKTAILSPQDIRVIAKDNLDSINNLNKVISKSLKKLTRIDKNALAMFENLFILIKNIVKERVLPNNITPLDSLATNALAQALVDARDSGKTNPLTIFKNDWLAKNFKNDWVLAGNREAKKLLAAADIYEQYLKKLDQKHLYDYDDMIIKCIDGLQASDELRYSLQEQYQYIMLDEFQDTNLAQLKLIELLTNNPASAGRPNVLAVGDDDQAIFSFQGADLTNMLRFYDMYKDVNLITLTENWRSHGDIITAAQNISNQIEERLHKHLGLGEKMLVAKNGKLPPNAIIERREFQSDLSELDWVANEINKNINQSIKPDKIAVIAPKHKYLEALVPFLEDLKIPIRYEKRENVFDDPRVKDLINMARLVTAINEGDQTKANSLWPSVLSGAEWGLPTSEIWQLSWVANSNRYLKGTETDWQPLMMKDKALKPIALFFARLAMSASSETLETMLDYLTGITALKINEPDLPEFKSPYFEYYFGEKTKALDPAEFFHLLSNLTVLRQHLRSYKRSEDKPLYLNDLLEFASLYEKADEKLLNTSPYRSSQKAVQLQTAYKAKGLEYDVVFVLAASDEIWGMRSRTLSSNMTLPKNLRIIRHAGSSKDERKRLFYVALTRAKHTLYITSFKQDFAGKNTSYLEFLDESDQGGEITSNVLPNKFNKVIQSDHKSPELKSLKVFWQTRHVESLNQAKLKDLLAPRLEKFQLSATHVNSFIDLVYGGPENFFFNTILKFPKAPTADGQYGNAMHETLESVHIHQKNKNCFCGVDKALEIFEQKLWAKRLAAADFKRQLGRGQIALKCFLPAWKDNFRAENSSEINFRNEGVFVGGAHLTGKIDHIFINKKEHIIEVVDFKTGAAYEHWVRNEKLHKYRQQLMFYKLLLENSHTYKNYQATKGRLVFVEPSEEGNIAQLHMDFDPKELEEFKLLIKAVWHRIMNLDFPDISGYQPTLKGIKSFEDWLIKD